MKCSLISLIDALKLEFPLETCGNTDLQITDLQGLTPDNPPAQPDVLYTIAQNQLLRYQGAPARGTGTVHRSYRLDPAAQSGILSGADFGALSGAVLRLCCAEPQFVSGGCSGFPDAGGIRCISPLPQFGCFD